MSRRLLLVVVLLTGCTARSEVAVDEERPPAVDTDFNRLSDVLSGIDGAGEVLLYEGLPSEFWEPELRQKALKELETAQLFGYAVYDEAQALNPADADELTRLLTARESFARYSSQKACGGFQPEFGVQWQAGDAATVALISLECGEVKLYGPRGELYCDLVPDVVLKLKPLLNPLRRSSLADDRDD